MSELSLKALSFEEIRGQERALFLLEKAISSGRLPHAYLFVGPPGVGRETTALSFFGRLICLEGRFCKSCLPCRKFLRGVHPDVEILAPQGKNIKIEQIRALEGKLYFQPLEGQRRLILLPQAELLTREAANALLKSLEEPPPYTLFVLLAQTTEAILPTIVSRCQLVRFRPLSSSVLKELLIERFEKLPEEAEGLAVLAEGSLGRALRLAEKGMLEELFRFVQAVSAGRPSYLVNMAEAIAALKEEQPLFWELVLLWLRRAWLSYLGLCAYPALLPARPPRAFIPTASEKIMKIFPGLEANLNPELLTLSLLTELARLWGETKGLEVSTQGAGAA